MQGSSPAAQGPAAEVEAFYEGYVEHHVPYHRSPRGLKGLVLRFLPYWSWREWRFWKRWTPAGSVLLDLGCARGREIFRERARVCVGADIAPSALAECAQHYDMAVQSMLGGIPFRSNSFDCVVSSHVMGHIPAADKDTVIGEIARVLKPGGRSLHVIETDSKHPFVELAKQDAALYQRYLIEQDGHVGLELAPQVIERFAGHGLRCVYYETMEAGPIHPRLLLKWFDNEYASMHPQIGRQVEQARHTLASPARFALTEIRLGLHHVRTARRAPLEDAQFLAVVFEKGPAQNG
jgi:ubiquinone/menaquinone biosynthesis C-methylase UbiE